MTLILEAKERGALRGENPPVPAPAYADPGFEEAELDPPAETLLRAHGTISDRNLTRSLLATLVRDLVLTVTSGVGDSMVTHVQFKEVAAIPPAGTTRKTMFDQINKFLVALGIKSADDWGEIGSSSQPFSLMASYRVVRYRAQDRIDTPLFDSTGIIQLSYIASVFSSALSADTTFDFGIVSEICWNVRQVYDEDREDPVGVWLPRWCASSSPSRSSSDVPTLPKHPTASSPRKKMPRSGCRSGKQRACPRRCSLSLSPLRTAMSAMRATSSST